jgi:hypothetical protein
METEEEIPRSTRIRFRYKLARAAVDDWIGHVNDAHLNWAWEIFQRTAEVYADLGRLPGETPAQALAAVGHDFFDAWHDGAANFGIIGIMHELRCSCPDGYDEDLERIMALAWEAGRKGAGVPHDARRPRAASPAGDAPPAERPALRVLPGGIAGEPPRHRARAGHLGLVGATCGEVVT